MGVVSLALMVIAFVLFVLAALSVAVPRVNLIGAGLAFWILAVMLGHFVAA